MSQDEKALLVYLGQLYDEVIILLNAYLCSGKKDSNDIVHTAQFCQANFFMKLLAGKIFEGWQAIDKKYTGSGVSATYNKHLAPEAKDAMKYLRRYFSQKNLIKHVRDKFAFHQDYGMDNAGSAKEFDALSDKDCAIYVSNIFGNNFFLYAESVVSRRINDAISIDQAEGMDPFEVVEVKHNKLFNEVKESASHILTASWEIIKAILKSHGLDNSSVSMTSIPNPPSWQKRTLPYFLKHDKPTT